MVLKLVGFVCSWSSCYQTVSAVGAQPSKVRISYSSRSNTITPLVLAAQKGFFTEEGVDVELIQVNPRLGATALLNGDID